MAVMTVSAQAARRSAVQQGIWIYFDKNVEENTELAASPKVTDVLSEGYAQYVSGITTTKATLLTNGNVQLGTAEANGKITLKLDQTYKARSIQVYCTSLDEENKIKVNGEEKSIDNGWWNSYKFTFDEDTDVSEVAIETTGKRAVLSWVNIVYTGDTKVEATIDFSKKWDEDQAGFNGYVDTWQGVDLYLKKSDGNYNPKYTKKEKAVWLYANNRLELEANDWTKRIKKVEFTFEAGHEATADCFEVGTYADGVWTGEENFISMINKVDGTIIRIQKMVVTYDEAAFSLYTGGMYGMNPFTWNDEDQVYEYNLNVWNENYKFAIADLSTMPNRNDDQAVFDFSHRFAIGAGNVDAKIGEAMTLGNYGAAYINIKEKGLYKLTLTKDKQLTITERKRPYVVWEFEKDENGNAKFDDAGYLTKDSLVLRYDNKVVNYQQSVWDGIQIRNNVSWWSQGNSYAHNTKKIVFDKSFADYDEFTSLSNFFNNLQNLETIEGLENLNTENVKQMNSMFYNCQKLKKLDLTKLNTQNVENMNYMFYGCNSLKELNLSNLSNDKLSRIYYMFSGCSALETLNMSGFGLGEVTSLSGLFQDLTALKTLNLSNVNTENITNMSSMFSGCTHLKTLDLSNFNTEKVTSMSYMFQNCDSLATLDLSNFNTEKVTDMSYMFNDCDTLKTIDLSSFNTERVTDMSSMFQGCDSLKNIDLSNFIMTSPTVDQMFYGCTKLEELNLIGFDYPGDYMFYNDEKLKSLIVNKSFRDNGAYSESYQMFYGCVALPNFVDTKVNGWDWFTADSCAIDKYATVVTIYNLGKIGAGKYMTYYVDDKVKLAENVDASVVLATITSVGDDKVNAEELKVAGALTPLIIYNGSEEAQPVKLITAYEKGDVVNKDIKACSQFQGTLTPIDNMPKSGENLDYYICNGDEFVWVMYSGTINANRCWLEIEKDLAGGAQAAPRRTIVFGGDNATGINTVNVANQKNAEIFDLQGRKVSKAQKGLYIINGKKVVVK